MRTTISVGLLFASAGLLACSSDATPAPAPAHGPMATGESSSAERIPRRDDPDSLGPGASYVLAEVVAAADVGRTFSVPTPRVPYPDTYWAFDMQDPFRPYAKNGIDSAWQRAYGHDAPSPLEKYMSVTAPGATAAAKGWEQAHHGEDVDGVESWYGHCNGWTGAAVYGAPVTHPVWAAADGAGSVAPCTEGGAGCVRFEIGDIHALQAEIFVNAPTHFIGARCDESLGDVNHGRDKYGRLPPGCRGLNPGALLVVASRQIRGLGQAFSIDAQSSVSTDQIWNQPAYAYRVNSFERVDERAAIDAVARNGHTRIFTRPPSSYLWNTDARGFAVADVTLFWVKENWPGYTYVAGTASTHEMHVRAVVELDRDASDPAARILGGEYLDEPSRFSSGSYDRITVPPFVWIPTGPGEDGAGPHGGAGVHNPYVRSAVVQKLVALGT